MSGRGRSQSGGQARTGAAIPDNPAYPCLPLFWSIPMQGDPQVIHFLQAQLKNELTAINQYFVHYRMFKHWGFERMAKKEY
jgi:hypothetical protein